MKRLRFKTRFNGFSNAVKMIPDKYRIDGGLYEITDGVETFKIKWKGSAVDGDAELLKDEDRGASFSSSDQTLFEKPKSQPNTDDAGGRQVDLSLTEMDNKGYGKNKSIIIGIAILVILIVIIAVINNKENSNDEILTVTEAVDTVSNVTTAQNSEQVIANTQQSRTEQQIGNYELQNLSPELISAYDSKLVAQKVKEFYDADNEGNIERICQYFSFPVVKYYNENYIDYEKLYQMYSVAFTEKLSYHKINIFWDKSTVEKFGDGYLAKIEANYQFITQKTPDEQKSRYIKVSIQFDQSLQITSVYESQ